MHTEFLQEYFLQNSQLIEKMGSECGAGYRFGTSGVEHSDSAARELI
jgi:hypothetical protein